MHVMNDLETLDTKHSAVIVSIGMVSFTTEGLESNFYRPIIVEGQDAYGRTTSQDTVKWWAQQSEEARKVFTDPNRVSLRVALQDLTDWMQRQRTGPEDPVLLWGNGADFDNAILSHAYHSLGIPQPWKFFNSRCYRTLKNLGVEVPVHLSARQGVHHNSLDDSQYQALIAIHILKHIKGM